MIYTFHDLERKEQLPDLSSPILLIERMDASAKDEIRHERCSRWNFFSAFHNEFSCGIDSMLECFVERFQLRPEGFGVFFQIFLNKQNWNCMWISALLSSEENEFIHLFVLQKIGNKIQRCLPEDSLGEEGIELLLNPGCFRGGTGGKDEHKTKEPGKDLY